MKHYSLTERRRQAILATFPETGADWIADYSELLSSLLDRWQLTILGEAKSGLPINIVYFVRDRQGTEFVLKVGHPHPEQNTESIVLNAQKSPRMVRLVAEDRSGYGFLLERIRPGSQLREKIDNPEAILSALELHRDLPLGLNLDSLNLEGLPSFEGWLAEASSKYRDTAQPDTQFLSYLENAERLFSSLQTSIDCLLHGDLHHENILLADGEWKAIDPKGVIGPACMEAGRFLHNFLVDESSAPLQVNDRSRILVKRFEQASTVLPSTDQALADITFIDLVLSTCWTLNRAGDATDGLATLVALRPLISN